MEVYAAAILAHGPVDKRFVTDSGTGGPPAGDGPPGDGAPAGAPEGPPPGAGAGAPAALPPNTTEEQS